MLKLSIITINKNNLNGLIKTYESIKNQTNVNFEWIVIDGLSQDGSREFIGSINNESNNYRFIIEKDEGIYDAMQKGLSLAKGEFINFLNSGDIYLNNNTLSELIQKFGIYDLVYGDSVEELFTNKLFYKPANSVKKIKYGMFACHPSIFYRTEKAQKINFSKEYKVAGDYEFTSRFLIYISFNTLKINRAVSIFDLNGISNLNKSLGRIENFKIQRKIHNMNILKCLFVQFKYYLSFLLKKYFFNFYILLKYKNNF